MIQDVIRQKIQNAVTTAFPEVGGVDFSCSHPESLQFGDFSANVALVLAKQVGQPPLHVAQAIVAALPPDDIIASAEAVAPGFINIRLTQTWLWGELQRSLGGNYGRDNQRAETVVFEYGDPNTHKIPHVGHLFSYIYGESCSRLLESMGTTVKRASYQGDIGPHVAKCIWAYLKNNRPDPESLTNKIEYLQLCYQEGSGAYDDDPEAKTEIDSINRRIYDQDPELMSVWQKTRQWCVESYAAFETRLGISYDQHYWESEIYAKGLEAVHAHMGDIFEEDQGAVIFRGEKYDLHTRVFINRHGNPTYEAKDLGLVQHKWQDYHFDQAIVETGNDQKEYWHVEKKVIELLFPEITGKVATKHHGMINLTTGKMSSRTGEIITAFSLVDQVRSMIAAAMENSAKKSEFTPEEQNKVIEALALGAIKYSFLKTTPEKNITFDPETSISSEGNSGPYLQYTYARCRSVLSAVGEVEQSELIKDEVTNYELNEEEQTLLRLIYRYPLVVGDAAERLTPHTLCTYLYELAQAFSYFYNQHRIVGVDDMEQKVRTLLTASVASILKSGLHLLGIDVVERV